MTAQYNAKETSRTIYFDYLRVFASIAIMLLHISSDQWAEVDVNSSQWQTLNVYNSISRWGVAVFVMISGAIFLSREIPISKTYSKYILRMVLTFIAWSTFYAVYEGGAKKEMMESIILGCYHMWFILMIIGLYACLPFLRRIAQDRKTAMYFFALFLVFTVLMPETTSLIKDFGGDTLNAVIKLVNKDIRKIGLNMITGFSGYFLLGYYLNNYEFSKKQRRIIYAAGILGFAVTIVLSSLASLRAQAPNENYFDSFTVNILLECVAVFVWFKYRKFENTRMNLLFQHLSKYSFGAYLVHVLIIRKLRRAGFDTLMMNPIGSVILILAAVCFISFMISAVLNHVPIVKKYLV